MLLIINGIISGPQASKRMPRTKSLAKRIGVIAIGLILLVVIVAGGFFAAMQRHFHPSPPQAHFPPAASALEAQRQAIRYFRQLIALDRSFAPAERVEAESKTACTRGARQRARSTAFSRVADAN